jgi:protein tyrosine phosphatase
MDIGYSGMVNEYLAAQGPLSDTCGDFWQVSILKTSFYKISNDKEKICVGFS